MEGDEQVGVVVVGDLRAAVQLDEHVRLAGVDDLHVGAVFRNELADTKGDIQVHILLLQGQAYAAGVVAAMSRVNHHFEVFSASLPKHRHCGEK